MKTQQEYKTFNNEKTIAELQYNMQRFGANLQFLKKDLDFLGYLVNSTIYKVNMMDLFENLERFKKEILKTSNKCDLLIIEANFQANQITQKIECDELACDNYFISTQNNLEKNIYDFSIQSAL
ncbi:hypothetical protein, partial [Xanthomarina sp.]|uniref:hypothetical protein n=1 Tax=Xanthomarina sp. TaxID=1931211 RepID=UPI002C2252DC